MELKEYWDGFVKFLVEYDTQKVLEVLRELDWKELAGNPLLWLIGGGTLILMLWKRMIRLMIFMASLAAFLVLLQQTLPSPGQAMDLNNLLLFIGGTIGLLVVNLYFIFIRE